MVFFGSGSAVAGDVLAEGIDGEFGFAGLIVQKVVELGRFADARDTGKRNDRAVRRRSRRHLRHCGHCDTQTPPPKNKQPRAGAHVGYNL
jgi:hypothetical protein